MQNPEALYMKLADNADLLLIFSINLSIITYVIFWVIILPLVDGDHYIHKYFLPQEYLIFLQVHASVSNLCLAHIFNAIVMLKYKTKKWHNFESRAVVFLLCSINVSILTYYTIWVIIMPFVDGDHFIQKYFYPQKYAFPIFGCANMALLCLAFILNGLAMLKSKEKEARC